MKRSAIKSASSAVAAFTVIGFPIFWMLKGEDRVADARQVAQPKLEAKLRSMGMDYPPNRVFLRGFKEERVLEVWVAKATGPYRLFEIYPIAALSGKLGPKRQEGDLQVPEGFYSIDLFNPKSRYLLSMRVNYPNASDRKRGKTPLGGDIYIHGDQKSIGCLAMTDPVIQELYVLVFDTKSKVRPVHLFPARMTENTLQRLVKSEPNLAAFWRELKTGYDAFEATRLPPTVKVGKDGSYQIQ